MDKKEEKPVEEPKEEGYDYAKDHGRDIQSIAKEPVIPEKESEPKPEEKKEEPVVSPLDEAKRYMEEQKAIQAEEARKIADERAKETAREEVKRTKEQEAQFAKEEEEMKPIWERENRTPKDWQEIHKEDVRIAKLELKREQRAEQEAQKAERLKQEGEVTKLNEKQMATIQEKIKNDLEELYAGGYLIRPKTADPKDPGEVEKKALFETGIKVNLERQKKGEPPLDIMKIYFMHHAKAKVEQPAGADAPVSGAKPAVKQSEDKGYNYAKDHKKSFRQIALEAQRKAN